MVVQWIGICLPMQETQVQSLVQENSTRCGATNSLEHPCRSYSTLRLEPVLRNKKSHHSEKPVHAEKSSSCSLKLEKAQGKQRRSSTAKNKKINNFKVTHNSSVILNLFLGPCFLKMKR